MSRIMTFIILSLNASSKLMHQPVQTVYTKFLADAYSLRLCLFGDEAKLKLKYVHKKHCITF